MIELKSVTFLVLGGDLRQLSLAQSLAQDGHNVIIFGLEQLWDDTMHSPNISLCTSLSQGAKDADCIVGPLPICDEKGDINAPFANAPVNLIGLLDVIPHNVPLLAGQISPRVLEETNTRGILTFDYLKREEFAVRNAVATAEGAIQIAMEELPVTLDDAKCLVCGFGRIGKLLAHKLRTLGAQVTVNARKYSDFAWIRAYGYTPHHIFDLENCLDGMDVVFNTVPARIFGERELKRLTNKTLCIDLASKPGGFDFDTAGKLGVKVIWALSLPGKVAPVTAGTTIRETVVNILTENGIL